MCRSPLAHVNHFYIIVPVPGKLYETGVGSHLDQLSPFEQLLAIYDQLLFLRVKLLVDALPPVQNTLLFFRDD